MSLDAAMNVIMTLATRCSHWKSPLTPLLQRGGLKKVISDGVPKRQRGAALVTSLLFLLIMTVIGVTALLVATLEERMSGNLRARNLAFQAAESALRAGELAVAQAMANSTPPIVNCASGGIFPVNDVNCDGTLESTPLWQSVNWSSSQVVAYNYPQANVAAYIVEVVGCIPGGNGSIGNNSLGTGQLCTTGTDPCFYRITARGTGGSSTAVVVLRSIYTSPAVDDVLTNTKGVCRG